MTSETRPRAATRADGDVVPFRTAVRAWFAISLQTFGGPAGQIAVMQRTLVDEKRWIGQRRFLHALNYCMLLPGPEAQQLAIYVGWLLNGTRGGLVAGGLFVLPGVVALLALSAIYVALRRHHRGHRAVRRARAGGARHRRPGRGPGRQAGPDQPARWSALAVAAFLALAVFGVPFPVVIAVAGARRLGAGPLAARRAAAASGGRGAPTTGRRR